MSARPLQGYVSDTAYPETFFRELSPVWLNYVAALNAGAPRKLDPSFSYLELGCGAGHSTLIHAGAFAQGQFHACDLDPAYIEAAQGYAHDFGLHNVHFHAASFDELSARDLPDFDFIVAHGVYSWVGDEARRAMRRIVRDKLKPGGLVYLSYNCMPGWSSEVPLRRLLLELAAASSGDSSRRTEHALRTLEVLSGAKFRFFDAHPSAGAAVESYRRSPINYLAHEFLNPSWELFYSVDVADEMAEAGVTLIGSATLADNHPTLMIDESSGAAVNGMSSPRLRQLAADFAVDRRFRRDVYVRGEARAEQRELAQHMNDAVIGCLGNAQAMSVRARVPRGEIGFQEDFVDALRALMSRGSTALGEAVAALSGKGRDPMEIMRNLLYLIAAGTLTPFAKVFRPGGSPQRCSFASPTAEQMCAYVAERRIPGAIPSDVVGGGVDIDPMEAYAVTAFVAGARSVDALGARLAQRDSALDDPKGFANETITELVPRLMRLGVLH